MNFNDYQKETQKTAIYPKKKGLEYTVLGLSNEAGEVAGKLKKHIRGDIKYANLDKFTEMITSELGDVLWYVSQIATELNISLDHIACSNLHKLKFRYNNGTIKGDGDER